MNHPGRLCAPILCALVWLGPAATAPAQDADLQKQINKGIDRGVRYLKISQADDGTWPRDGEIGATALAAWTLLESGVPADHDAVVRAAAAIRKAVPSERKNYCISLCLIFLDRLGDPQDEPLLEALAVRLLTSQLVDGGWSYHSHEIPAAEQRRLANLVKNRKDTTVTRDPTRKPEFRDPSQLSKETIQQLKELARSGPGQQDGAAVADNSNTQFAMMALAVAGRHGIPIKRAMEAVETRFRTSQGEDGSWGYMAAAAGGLGPRGGRSYAMTCAGLLGVALGHANDKNRADKVDIQKDPVVKNGLSHLENIMNGRVPGGDDGKYLYFLWSLERMAVVYDLKKVGNIEWYPWGVEQLVASQTKAGSWEGGYTAGCCDTCFALLFLKRANVVEDITLTLKGIPKETSKTDNKPVENPYELPPLLPKEKQKKEGSKGRIPTEGPSSRLWHPQISPAADRYSRQAALLSRRNAAE